jgi:hypothetical protein
VGKSPAEERHRAGEVPRLGMAGEERGVEQGLVAAWPARRAASNRAWAERLHAWKEASHQVFAFFYLMCLVLDESVKTVLRPLLFNCFKNYGVYTCAVKCLTYYQLVKF